MYSVIKFQSPFERLKHYDSSPVVSLHKAIITQAIIDATNTSEDMGARKIEIEAKNWLFGNSENFKEICETAQMLPHFVRKIAKEAIILQRNRAGRNLKSSKYKVANKDNGIDCKLYEKAN